MAPPLRDRGRRPVRRRVRSGPEAPAVRSHRSDGPSSASAWPGRRPSSRFVATLTLTHGTRGAPLGHTQRAPDTSLVAPAVSFPRSSTSSTAAVALGTSVQDAVSRLRPSLVALISVGTGAAMGTGVVIGNGTLVITSASAVRGRSRMDAVTADGRRMVVRVVGSDQHSGVALLDMAGTGRRLAPAHFADEGVEPGEATIATCLCTSDPAGGSGPSPQVALSTVRVTGNSVDIDQGASLVDAIEADAPLSPDPAGGVLLDSRGRVIGILDGVTADGDGELGVFVPAPLAVGVAEELADGGQLTHGWLGLNATDVPGRCGAQVVGVMPALPAAMAGVAVGDVVDEVDGHQVCSLAELQARLYVAPPGRRVSLQVETPAGVRTLSMALIPAA